MPSSSTPPGRRDPAVDGYIAQASPFARPILEHVRAAMHAACPEVTEAIKWSHPFYLLGGKPFASTASFKAHCALGFWRGGKPIAEAVALASPNPKEKAMGQFGRIESLSDLPAAAELRQLIVEARKAFLAAQEAKAAMPTAPRAVREVPAVPDDLAAALRTQRAAQKAFKGFTPSQQREYVDWIVEAKREATRASRIVQAIEWIAEGKTRNWKYQTC